MSSLKRPASSSITRLTARASPYSTSVTLFEAEDNVNISPRRSKRIKLELEVNEVEEIAPDESVNFTPSEAGPSTLNKSSKSPRKPKPIQQSLAVPHPAPEKWQEIYETIKHMRAQIVAPVDTMGCDQAQYKEKDPKVSKPAL